MSDFFNDKQYGEYFEKLNKSLANERAASPASKRPARKKRKGFYKVLRLRRSILAAVFVGVVVLAVVLTTGARKKYDTTTAEKDAPVTVHDSQKTQQSNTSQKIVFTSNGKTAALPAENDAKSGIIVRLSDGKIIAERNPDQRVYPASTVKVMTMLTALDYLTDLDDTFTMTYEVTDPLYIAEATVAGFLNGETVTVRDLLYGMILPSGADGAVGLAIKAAGSEEEFVKLMNKKAEELGLKNTHFTNVSGLFNENNYSSAYDMAVITKAAMENKICREILSAVDYTTEKTPQNPEGIQLFSTLFNHMYGTEPETATILGGKTGFVNESGYCVTSFGKSNSSDEEYIVVTMGNSSKWPAFYGQIDLYKEFAK